MRPELYLYGILIFCLSAEPSMLSAQSANRDEAPAEQHENLRQLALHDANAVNLWWWGWLGGYGAATVGQGIAGFSSGKLSFRQDMLLSAATTFIGAAGQMVSAVRPVSIGKSGLSDADSASLNFPDEESLIYLEKSAAKERKGRGWQIHLVSGAVNLSGGLVTWLGFKRTWKDGLINFAINTAVAEAQIWSQPMYANRIMENRNKSGKLTDRPWKRQNPGYTVSLISSGNGFCLLVRF